MKFTSTSKDELIIYYYIQKVFPDAISRYQFITSDGNVLEADIYIPEIKVAIEYDGAHWHKNKFDRDVLKTELFNEEGIYVIHVREYGLKSLPSFYGLELWHVNPKGSVGLHTHEYITAIMNDISKFCSDPQKKEYLSRYSLSYDDYKLDLPDINSIFYDERVSNSVDSIWLLHNYWDYEKNGRLKPENVPRDANIKVYIHCPAGSAYVNITSIIDYPGQIPKVLSNICPFVEMLPNCGRTCEYFNNSISSFVDHYLDGDIEQLNDDDIFSIQRYLAQREDIIGLSIVKYLYGSEHQKERFEQLFLKSRFNVKALLGLQFLDLHSPESLDLILQLKADLGPVRAKFNALEFDKNNTLRTKLLIFIRRIIDEDNSAQTQCLMLTDLLSPYALHVPMSTELKTELRSIIPQDTFSLLNQKLRDIIYC